MAVKVLPSAFRGGKPDGVASPVDDLRLPHRVDAFTLTTCVGTGAMGAVYHAVEDITGREVAIKIMAAKLVGNKRAESRFRREISAMGILRHPGIPTFAGYGDLPDGRPYLAMELIKGHTLDAFVGFDRPLAEELALWVVLQLGEVLGYCHRESGMIHRDLKPGNIMVDLAGQSGLNEHVQLKILDFGLATFIDFGDFDDFSAAVRGYAGGGTMTGEVMGTPAYMSPEQIRGGQLGFQSDIYALGGILFHLLTGRLPYEGSSVGVVMAKHLDAPVPDPSQFMPVRPTTAGVVQRAMAKTPEARYRSYTQLCAALQSARYAALQATRRFTAPGERREPPATRSTEAERHPSSNSWTHPPAPAGRPDAGPGDPGTPVSWSRQPLPALTAAPPPADQPTSTRWRRPVNPPLPASPPLSTPALERPSTNAAARPVEPPPPARPEAVHEPSEAVPLPDPPPVAAPPGSAQWRRPVPTPDPGRTSPP